MNSFRRNFENAPDRPFAGGWREGLKRLRTRRRFQPQAAVDHVEPRSEIGFGLGFGIVTDTAANGAMGSAGQYYWGGGAGTVFGIDPVENLVVVSMMQLMGGWPAY